MLKNEYNVIGVMSGTSLDGIDLAYIHLKKTTRWHFKILTATTVAYSEKWVTILKTLTTYSKQELESVDKAYTTLLAQVISTFIQNHKLVNLDAVCSHGHTALHDPSKGFTYQIGNRPELAKLINETVVCDFRVQDVELGGQGAPLVPIGDALLFKQYDYCLNLGGFANISVDMNNKRIAYDVCPVNIVLNHYTNRLGLLYDDKGKLASEGMLNEDLLHALNELSFYKKSFPKSLGLEWVQSEIFPLINKFHLDVKDVLRTFVEHAAFQIAQAVQPNTKVLITGGGAFNTFLLERLQVISQIEIVVPQRDVVEYKEALIFALLGVLRLRNEVNCLSSVTGALRDHSSGFVYKI